MNRKICLLFALAMALAANAAPVNSQSAASAATAWAKSGTVMGLKLNATVDSVTAYAVTNNYAFYAVKLKDSGTVFVSSDTEMDPIIGFTGAASVDLAKGSPLRMLLDGDIAYRAALLRASTSSTSASSTSTSSTSSTRAWATLLPATGKTLDAADPQVSVDDVRVAPLLETKWSQDTVGYPPVNCYNYYTPYNYVCGCTATALSQVMRYFKYPTAEQSAFIRACSCEVNGKIVSTNLTTIAGAYAWELMTAEPDSSTSEKSRQAIGQLTYNVGVFLNSKYTDVDGTSALPDKVAKVLRDDLGYANAVLFLNEAKWYTQEGGLHSLSIREKTIYANLDAHLPVQLGIYGYPVGHDDEDEYWGGHAVVADGYGYKQIDGETVAFVHINLGWSGYDDLWYNLPSIHTGTGIVPGGQPFNFDYLGAAIFNIMPDATGEILSGRVTDIDGKPVGGAKVKAVNLAAGAVAGETTTDEHGIYALTLAGLNTYRLTASNAKGTLTVIREQDVTLGATNPSGESYQVDAEGSIGNRWGNDIVLEEPSVRIGSVNYVTLDSALEAAKATVEADPQRKIEVEIFASTRLRRTVTVDFPCTIRTVGADPSEFTVTRSEGAVLDIAADGSLALSNVIFTAAATNVVNVAAGGVLKLGGGVDFGMPSDQVSVRTADAGGLEVMAGLTSGFLIDCAAARNTNEAFGSFSCDLSTAQGCASLISNYYDEFGEIRGTADSATGQLVWKDVPVPLSEAAGYYTDAEGTVHTFARLGRVFDKFAAALKDGSLPTASELVLLKGGSFTNSITIAGDVTIRGQGDIQLANLSNAVGFVITGGTLKVKSLTFDGYLGHALFQVQGGNLELADCRLYNVNGNDAHSGAVAVDSGSVKTERTVFGSCQATGVISPSKKTNAYGGAIWLAGSGCSLELLDTVITNCTANYKNGGGGVYAANGSTVAVGGATRISGNVSGSGTGVRQDNLGIRSGATLTVSRLMTSDDPLIGVNTRVSGAGEAGYVFAAIGAGVLSEDPTARTMQYELIANCFFNDQNAELEAGDPDAAGTCARLAWATIQVEDHTDPTDAVCYLSGRGDEQDGYYRRVVDAFRAARDGETIALLADDMFASDILVTNRISLVTATDAAKTLSRNGGYSISVEAGGDLTVSNVCVRGCLAGESVAQTVPLFAVNGGALTLDDGVTIRDALGEGRRDANAVTVWNGGTVTMLSGSLIEDCANTAEDAFAGALLVDGGNACLKGGKIADCSATSAPGVMIASGSRAEISGDFRTEATYVTVSVNSQLYLPAAFAGYVRYQEGKVASTSQFARVSWTTADLEAVNASAQNFWHGDTSDRGLAATNATETILVWSQAVGSDGYYTDDQGVKYHAPYAKSPEIIEPQPFALSIVLGSDGKVRVGCDPVTVGCWYSLWSTASLGEEFEQVGEKQQLSAGGEFVLEGAGEGESHFYKVIAEPGTK